MAGLGAKFGIMGLHPGDSVKTESGEVGKVVHISRLTVFVALPVHGNVDRIEAFLASQLIKIASPDQAPDRGQ
jgi:preprotein translocase subunit YajC